MRGLDLFSGAGGATRGYMDAGHEMVGVDWRPQPRYAGSRFILQDVMVLLTDERFISGFDFIHASPPCQFFSSTSRLSQNGGGKMDLLTPTLDYARTKYADKVWIIENVPEAPLPHDETIMLCGSQFPNLCSNLDPRRQLRRHRKFYLQNLEVPAYPKVSTDRFKGSRKAETCKHNGFRPLGVYGHLGDNVPGGGSTAGTMSEASALMGIDGMLWRELREAIPPAYTHFIGRHIG